MTRSFMERLVFPHFTYDYDEHFPIDLQKAYDLGKRLVEKK